MADIQSATAENMRGKKKKKEERKKKKPQGKNIMSASATQDGHNMLNWRAVYKCAYVGYSVVGVQPIYVFLIPFSIPSFLPPLPHYPSHTLHLQRSPIPTLYLFFYGLPIFVPPCYISEIQLVSEGAL